MISDTELIRLAYSGTDSAKRHKVVFTDGSVLYFAIETKRDARRIGSEYGVRFLHGARVMEVETVA